jgi:hypothetical protein
LAEKAKITLTDGTINKLGKALKKHNFIRISKKTGYVYAVKEFTWEEVENKSKEKDPLPPPPKNGVGGLPTTPAARPSSVVIRPAR